MNVGKNRFESKKTKIYKKKNHHYFMKDKYHCPRCKNTEFIDYGETVECTTCRIGFDKKVLGNLLMMIYYHVRRFGYSQRI